MPAYKTIKKEILTTSNLKASDEERINSLVLKGLQSKDELKGYDRWYDFLKQELTFPIDAVINPYDSNEVFTDGDFVKITSLSGCADLYGILVNVKFGRKKYIVALCELEATDKKSKDYHLLNYYNNWFSNK